MIEAFDHNSVVNSFCFSLNSNNYIYLNLTCTFLPSVLNMVTK